MVATVISAVNLAIVKSTKYQVIISQPRTLEKAENETGPQDEKEPELSTVEFQLLFKKLVNKEKCCQVKMWKSKI